MRIRPKEIAKFVCGVQAFHALVHTYFWYSGTSLHVLGVDENPTWHKRAAIGNALVSLALGLYAWRDTRRVGGTRRGLLPRCLSFKALSVPPTHWPT